MTKIAVVVGSTRQGRHTDKLAKWVAKDFEGKADVEIVDLRDFPIPFLNDEISPRYNPERKVDAETQKWLDKIAEFDGYVFVTPEYNRSTSGVLKNAIDVLAHEMDHKPVAIVAHGTYAGGQAITNLRAAIPGIGAITIPTELGFGDRLSESISDDGELKKEIAERPYGPQTRLAAQVAELLWYAEALTAARNK